MISRFFVFTFALLAGCFTVSAQSIFSPREDPEKFRIEVTGSAWLLNSGGQIQSNGTPADFINDLNVFQRQPTFFGQLVIKPARRHRIVIEGTPFSIDGRNVINRTIIYRGQTFSVNQTVISNATLDYFFGGYQYDVLSSPHGHLGFSVGAAYLNATGTLQTPASQFFSGVSATKNQKIGLPLAGVDFRIFPIPGHKFFEVEGGIRGMAFGDYGYYGQAIGQAGVNFGVLTLLGGYRAVNTSIYVDSNGSASGITARLKGPIFSAMFRW